jgi:hypothetical protein
MKHTPKHQDPEHIKRLKQKYGSLNKQRTEIVGNPEGGKEIFWVLYLTAMVIYIINIMYK